MGNVIGIDIGTSSCKVVVLDKNLNEICNSCKQYDVHYYNNGYAEQNPMDWYYAVLDCFRDISKKDYGCLLNIKSIGITGQMHSLVLLDEFDNILRPAILWSDQRSYAECSEIIDVIGEQRLIDITGNTALAGFTLSKLLWVKNNEPNIYSKINKVLLPKDFIKYKLTGVFNCDFSDASGTQLLDISNRKWSHEICNSFDINMEWLPELSDSQSVIGKIHKNICKLLNIHSDVYLVAGAGDNAASAIGCGVVNDNDTFISIGTSGVIYTHKKNFIKDKKSRMHVFCSPIPKEYHVMTVTLSATNSLNWFYNNILGEKYINYSDMENNISNINIGSDNLIFLPYINGERSPINNSHIRGLFYGLSSAHNKHHIIRSIIEGVSYSILDCFEILKENDIFPKKAIVCGGGSNSLLWRQIISSMLNLPLEKKVIDSSPSYGAAILAAVGIGYYPSIFEAVKSMFFPINVFPIIYEYEFYKIGFQKYKLLQGNMIKFNYNTI